MIGIKLFSLKVYEAAINAVSLRWGLSGGLICQEQLQLGEKSNTILTFRMKASDCFIELAYQNVIMKYQSFLDVSATYSPARSSNSTNYSALNVPRGYVMSFLWNLIWQVCTSLSSHSASDRRPYDSAVGSAVGIFTKNFHLKKCVVFN